MVNAIDDLVILTSSALLSILCGILLCLALESIFSLRGVLRILSVLLIIVLIVASMMMNVKYQELLAILLVILLLEVISLRIHKVKKENEEEKS